MCRKQMKVNHLIAVTLCCGVFAAPVKADFGSADFPIGMFDSAPKSYHNAWCRKKSRNVVSDFRVQQCGLRDKVEFMSLSTRDIDSGKTLEEMESFITMFHIPVIPAQAKKPFSYLPIDKLRVSFYAHS